MCAQDTASRTKLEARGEEAFKKTFAKLSASDANERALAADELGRRGYRFRKQIGEALRPMLVSDRDPIVRAAAGRALGRLGTREAVPELIKAMGDASAEVRVVAAAALWRLPDPQAVPVLIERTRDGDAKVREWCALALGVAGDARAVPTLVGLLGDSERAVRLAAVRSLGRVNRSEALAPLANYVTNGKRDDEEKDEVVNSVASIEGSERVATLLSLYASAAADIDQKRRVLLALSKVGDAQALPMLKKLSQQKDDGRGLHAPAVAAYNAVVARVNGAGSGERAVPPLAAEAGRR